MAITKYVSEVPYSDVTDNQVQLSTESSIDDFYRSIRDGTDNVLVEYHKEHQGSFGGYEQLRDSLDTIRVDSQYNNLGLDECRLVEVRSTDIKLANNGNIAFNGEITDVIIVSGGAGYSSGELYTDDTYGSGFKASYTVDSSGIIDSVTVINSGSGYVSPPTLYFTVGSSNTATADLVPILSSTADTGNKLVLPLQLRDTGVTAGDYTLSNITVDSTGRIKRISTTAVDSSITDASTNPVENNAVFDGLALKLDLAGGALTGDITITDTTAPQLKLLYNGTNYAQFEIASTGSLEIETVGSGTTDSDITLNADGDIILEAAGGDLTIDSDVKITATKKLYLDGGGDTHIKENSADSLVFTVGNDVLFGLVEDGTNGNYANFKASCAGFTRQEAVFSVTGVIGSAGTDDTDIDFRHSNKYRLEMTGDITNINLVFPIVSGNFLLVCTTDGDHDVTNWKVYVHDGGTPATTADVMWAGGSVPAFTNNGIDIVSFYWDKNEEQAYGTASLAFATP